MALYEELRTIDKTYDIPTYFEITDEQNESHFTKIYSTDLNYNLANILSIIGCDISNNIKNRIIGLSIKPKTSKERIMKRSREGESGYTDEQLQIYSTHYEKFLLHTYPTQKTYSYLTYNRCQQQYLLEFHY